MIVRPRRGLVQAAVLATLTGLAASAHAQLTNAPVDLEIFRPAMDSKGFVTVNSSAVLGQFEFSFGLVTSYARRPLVLEGGNVGNPAEPTRFFVDTLLRPSLQGAMGFTKMAHLGIELGIIIPMGVVAGHGSPSDPSTNPTKEWTFSNQGLGDIQLHPKFRFLNATRGGLGFAVIPSVILGTGDKDSFLGEGQTIFQPTAVVDTELGYLGRFRAAINVGMRIRPERAVFTDNAASFPRMVSGVPSTTGSSIDVKQRVHRRRRPLLRHRAAEVRPRRRALRELRLRRPQDRSWASASKMGPSAEAIGGIKLYLARNSFFELGGGYRRRRRLRLGGAARLPRLHLRAVDRRPRRRRLQGRRRQVPGRSRGLRRLRGRGRLPRAGQRQGRHPRRRRQVPERSRDQERRSRTRTAARTTPTSTATATASSTTSTSAPTIPRTRTASRTRTAAPIPTTTRTASSTSTTCARTIPRTRTASRTRTAAPIRTTTRTGSSTSTTSARTSPRPTTASRTRTAAPTRAGSSSRKGKLEILEKIYFETDRAEIKPVSFPILDAVAATLIGNPQIQLIEIQGHADERGDDDYNLDLTERRAAVGPPGARASAASSPAACEPRLRRDQADLHPAQRGLLEQEPPRRVHHPQAHRRSAAPGRRRPVARYARSREGQAPPADPRAGEPARRSRASRRNQPSAAAKSSAVKIGVKIGDGRDLGGVVEVGASVSGSERKNGLVLVRQGSDVAGEIRGVRLT